VRLALTALVGLSVVAVALATLAQRRSARAARALRQLADTDPLTGLANRSTIDATVDAALDGAHPGQVGVVAIGLQRFAAINEAHGVEVGDALLVAVADQLRAASSPAESVARYAGPSFVVTVPALGDTAAGRRRAAELQAAVEVPYQLGADRLRVRAAVGVAISDRTTTRGADLVTDARDALATAAAAGRADPVVFEPAMRARRHRADLPDRLEHALDTGGIMVRYLPVVELATNRIAGMEALVHWADPEQGVLEPEAFLTEVADTGLMMRIGGHVLAQALDAASGWARRFPHIGLVTAVHVSPRQLTDPTMADDVLTAIDAAGVRPGQLCLEITAGTLVADWDEARSALRRLRDAGVQVALDGFGVAHSPLGTLRRLPVDVIKIDPTLVGGVDRDRRDAAIVEQLVGLAAALDIVPVAEGVERAGQVGALVGMGCAFGQGRWFGPALPLETAERLVGRGRVSPGADVPPIDWSGRATGTRPG